MKTIVKLPILTISLFIILIGIFILTYNMGIIDQNILDLTLKLWPVILIISGAFLFGNSLYNKKHYKMANIKQKSYQLLPDQTKNELALKIDFSYGELWLGPYEKNCMLKIEQTSSLPEPKIEQVEQENSRLISVSMQKPIFPSPISLQNKWEFYCSTEDVLNLEISTHEANINLDLRLLRLENLTFRGTNGYHEIMFGNKQKKLKGNIYSSSDALSLIFLADVGIKLKLLNHFCRINYPQGDFVKQENGVLIHQGTTSNKSLEIIVDGPLKSLNIDFKEI